MLADPYGAATDLVARSAAAWVSGVPEDPADDGFFGPASVTWRVSTDVASPIAGLRSLLMQALHPLAMAGVDEHSGWRRDPVGRLTATVARLLGTPLSPEDSDRYVAEMVVAAELVGVPAALVPSSVGALERYIASVRPSLRCTPAAEESMTYMLDPPGMDVDVAGIWQDVRDGAIAALPAWAREMYGYRAADPLTPNRRTEIRQALGVMDAVFLGEPGVLEARQRLLLRMRAALRG